MPDNTPETSIAHRPTRPRQFRTHEIADILSKYRVMTKEQGYLVKDACAKIGEETGRSPDTIYNLVKRFAPTVEPAKAYLSAQALRLAMRIVRKANVQESIDILQRPDIGVLAPKQEGGPGPGTGFFLSVQADSCGAVKVGVGVAPSQPQRFEDLPQPLVLSDGGVEGQGAVLRSPSFEAPPQASGSPNSSPSDAMGVPYAIEEGATGDPTSEDRPSMLDKGVPHPNQGTFLRPELSPRQQEAIEKHKKRLREARIQAAKLKKREIEV